MNDGTLHGGPPRRIGDGNFHKNSLAAVPRRGIKGVVHRGEYDFMDLV